MPDYFLRYLCRRWLIIFLIIWINEPIFGRSASQEQETYRIMFYNLENLFDTYDDPLTNDDEFTPKGEKSWSYYRYQKKLNDLAKVIIALGEWSPPAIIGLCEVENFQVLLDLITKTLLAPLGYQIIHENSDDERGIDVALLYRSDQVEKISSNWLAANKGSEWKTRAILLAKMRVGSTDTITVMVNHWPSRYGGKEKTESKRIAVAKSLRSHVDSLQKGAPNSKILILGDFNDEPNDQTLSEVLDARKPTTDNVQDQLYNLSFQDFQAGKGTLVYMEINNTWFLFDQIIVSGSLIDNKGMVTLGQKCMIFDALWLLKNDKPFRTYQGPIYLGGYSDHLPIFIDLYKND